MMRLTLENEICNSFKKKRRKTAGESDIFEKTPVVFIGDPRSGEPAPTTGDHQ